MMAIQRWDPVRDIVQLQERMNRLIDDVLARSGTVREPEATVAAWKPPMDLFESTDRYVIQVDLPGVPASAVAVEAEGERLTIRGDRPHIGSVPREGYLRVERPHGRFVLHVTLPPGVDPGGIEAKHHDGVLEVSLPKRREELPGRIRVDVQ